MLRRGATSRQKKLAMMLAGNQSSFQIPRAGLAAQFDARTGITSSGGFASQWNDLSGNARHLLQATGANQPIHLPFSGEKYGWLPGVASNYFSTPYRASNHPTGDFTAVFKLAADDYTPSSARIIYVDGAGSGATATVNIYLYNNTAGTIELFRPTGSTGRTYTSTVALSSVVSDASECLLKVYWQQNDGGVSKCTFSYSLNNGQTYTQLGAVVTNANTGAGNNDATAGCFLGARNDGAFPFAGTVKSAKIYSGTEAGTLAVDFDASRWTSGTTFTASTGETWTINSTGSKPLQIVDRASLLFDGAAHYMKCNAFTLNQPETVYLVAKQVSWTSNDNIFDGNTGSSGVFYQTAGGVSPQVNMYAGNVVGPNAGLAIGSTGVMTVVFNGAGSSMQINTLAPTTGDAGLNNPGGFTLASSGGIGSYANIQAYEALIYNVAHGAATRANVIRALMTKHGVA